MQWKTFHNMRCGFACALMFALLSGCCEHSQYAVPVEVKMPVAVPCRISPPPEPDWNIPRLATDANALTEAKAELADLDLSKGYIAELRAALRSCI